jgi:hypothetical protein
VPPSSSSTLRHAPSAELELPRAARAAGQCLAEPPALVLIGAVQDPRNRTKFKSAGDTFLYCGAMGVWWGRWVCGGVAAKGLACTLRSEPAVEREGEGRLVPRSGESGRGPGENSLAIDLLRTLHFVLSPFVILRLNPRSGGWECVNDAESSKQRSSQPTLRTGCFRVDLLSQCRHLLWLP